MIEEVVNSAEVGDNETLVDKFSGLDKVEVSLCLKSTSKSGLTPLLAATKSGHLETVRLLVEEYGAGLEDRGFVWAPEVEYTVTGATPLWMAVRENKLKIIKYLIQKSVCVDVTTDMGETPLIEASCNGSLDAAQILIQNGARVNHCDYNSSTPLMSSCAQGHKALAEFLVKKGAQINYQDEYGRTALHKAAAYNHADVADWLLELEASNSPDSYGQTPLLLAASKGSEEVVELYLSKSWVVVSMLDKIEALEVHGAYIIVCGNGNLNKAATYWKRAIKLRERYNLWKSNIRSDIMKYRGYKEIETLADLRDVCCNPEQMQIQAAFIYERVLGPAHPEGIKRYDPMTSQLIWNVGAKSAYKNKERSLSFRFYNLCYLSLCLIYKYDEPLTSGMVERLEEFTKTIAKIMDKPALKHQVGFSQVLRVFETAVQEATRGHTKMQKDPSPIPEPRKRMSENFVKVITSIVQLMSLTCRILSEATEEEKVKFRSVVKGLVELNPRGAFGQTLLQLVSSEETILLTEEPVCMFPCENCIRLLQELGAEE